LSFNYPESTLWWTGFV